MDNNFAHNLTALRKDRGLSQKQVAADLKISQALLSHYEKGIRECGLGFVVKVSDYFDVSCDFLLGADRKPKEITNDNEQKIITSSISIVFAILKKINSKKLTNEVTHFLNFAVYTIIRYISKEDEDNFNIDKDSFSALTSAKMTLCKANIKKIIKNEITEQNLVNLKGFAEKENEIELLITIAEED